MSTHKISLTKHESFDSLEISLTSENLKVFDAEIIFHQNNTTHPIYLGQIKNKHKYQFIQHIKDVFDLLE
jgi:hypothetical protein